MKDERTRYETGNVQAVLDGDLDAFIEAFLQWRRSGARRVTADRAPCHGRSAHVPGSRMRRAGYPGSVS